MVAALLAYSLANAISQGKEKDSPILWEIFLGENIQITLR